jgi:hypothetical protein
MQMEFYRILRPGERRIHVPLFSCSLDQAPDRYSDNSTPLPPANQNPQLTNLTPTGVERVGRQIVGDLSGVDMSMFQTKIIDGETCIKFDHVIEVVLGDRVGTLLFRIKVGESSIGEASIEFSDS